MRWRVPPSTRQEGLKQMFEQHLGRSVTIDQAAALLHVSRRTIYNRIREGKLQTIRTIGGSQRVLLVVARRKPQACVVGRHRAAGGYTGYCGRIRLPSPKPAPTRARASRNVRPFGEERTMALRHNWCGHRSSHWPYAGVPFPPPRSGRRNGAPAGKPPQTRRLESAKQPIDVIVQGTDDEVAPSPRVTGCASGNGSAEGAVLQANAAGKSTRSARTRSRRARRRGDGRSCRSATRPSAPTRCRPGWRACDRSPARASASRCIDSGVWTGHRSLAGRVVFAKDFVGDATVRGRAPDLQKIVRPRDPHRRHHRRQLSVSAGCNFSDTLPRRRARRAISSACASSAPTAPARPATCSMRFSGRSRTAAASTSASSTSRWADPSSQSYMDDPMCEAVERAVHAGIVVVAAAGNRGKDAEGRSVYGLIESPGNRSVRDYGGRAEHEEHGDAARMTS